MPASTSTPPGNVLQRGHRRAEARVQPLRLAPPARRSQAALQRRDDAAVAQHRAEHRHACSRARDAHLGLAEPVGEQRRRRGRLLRHMHLEDRLHPLGRPGAQPLQQLHAAERQAPACAGRPPRPSRSARLSNSVIAPRAAAVPHAAPAPARPGRRRRWPAARSRAARRSTFRLSRGRSSSPVERHRHHGIVARDGCSRSPRMRQGHVAGTMIRRTPACRAGLRQRSTWEGAMALMDFIKKQFIDIIEWTEAGDGTLAWRFPMAGPRDPERRLADGARVADGGVRQRGQGGRRLRPRHATR